MSSRVEKPWGPQKPLLIEMWDTGVPIEEICRRLDRSMSGVINQLVALRKPLKRDNVDFALVGSIDPGSVLLERAARFAPVRVTAVNRAIEALEYERGLIDETIASLVSIRDRLQAFSVSESAVEIDYRQKRRRVGLE